MFESITDEKFCMVQLIPLAIIFSLLVFLLIGALLHLASPIFTDLPGARVLPRLFYFLSATLILLTFFLRKIIYRSSPSTLPGPEETAKQAAFCRIGHLIIFVFCEAIGLFGLMLLFLTVSFRHFLNLTLASLILLIGLYPRKMAVNNL